jgi:hypothetical protein
MNSIPFYSIPLNPSTVLHLFDYLRDETVVHALVSSQFGPLRKSVRLEPVTRTTDELAQEVVFRVALGERTQPSLRHVERHTLVVKKNCVTVEVHTSAFLVELPWESYAMSSDCVDWTWALTALDASGQPVLPPEALR